MSDHSLNAVLSHLQGERLAYEIHHGLSFSEEAIRAAAVLALRYPFESNDPNITGEALLDGSAHKVRVERMISQGKPSLVDVADVVREAARRTGLTVDELLATE